MGGADNSRAKWNGKKIISMKQLVRKKAQSHLRVICATPAGKQARSGR
jgi:hypothetical protein